MSKQQEVLQPIWDRWHNTNEISSKELCVLVWNAAIHLAAEEAESKTKGYSKHEVDKQSILNLKFDEK